MARARTLRRARRNWRRLQTRHCAALYLASALLGCSPRAPSLASSPVGAVRPTPPKPPPLPPLVPSAIALGDAEAELAARLASAAPDGLELFFQTQNGDETGCLGERFSAIADAGTRFSHTSGQPPSSLMAGKIESYLAPGDPATVHGVSSSSVLIDGSEWFFSRRECLQHPRRYPPLRVRPSGGPDMGALIDRSGEASVWFSAGHAVRVRGHTSAWLERGGTSYWALFYPGASVAWLEGPLDRPSGSELDPRFGLYSVRATEFGFELAGEAFCRHEQGCPTQIQAAASARLPGSARDGVVDFARQFWSYRGSLFVPMRDSNGVACKELRIAADLSASFSDFGRRREFEIRRRAGGFDFGWQVVGQWLWGRMAVHGRDESGFWLNGSPWFFEASACEAAKLRAKPANFRATGLPSLTVAIGEQRLPLKREYFALEDGPSGAACHQVKFFPLSAGGRLEMERETGKLERDYDFYEDEWGFWFGPPTLLPGMKAEQRYQGSFVVPERRAYGVSMGGVPWYESRAACRSAALARPAR